jgi:6-phosphogluconolactonase
MALFLCAILSIIAVLGVFPAMPHDRKKPVGVQCMQKPPFLRFADRAQCLQELAAILAARLLQDLADRSAVSLLLPGGSSPRALLPLLAAQSFPWAQCRLSPTDERWVAADAMQSNVQLLRSGLPDSPCLDPRLRAEPEQAAIAWAAQLQSWLPFSAVLLGMGEDGHIASLFPGIPGLDQALDLEQAPGALVGLAPDWPQVRLSLNLSMLLSTRWLGLLAFGETKRERIEAVLADTPQSRQWPLHALLWQSHVSPNIYWAP